MDDLLDGLNAEEKDMVEVADELLFQHYLQNNLRVPNFV